MSTKQRVKLVNATAFAWPSKADGVIWREVSAEIIMFSDWDSEEMAFVGSVAPESCG